MFIRLSNSVDRQNVVTRNINSIENFVILESPDMAGVSHNSSK